MDLINMLEGNRSEILKEFFKSRWEENFITDSYSGEEISYKNFFSAIVHAKEKLERLGLKKGETVCVLADNSVDLIILYFACLISQSVVVPIDPQKGEDGIKEILSQADYKMIIHNRDDLSKGVHLKEICGRTTSQGDISGLNVFDEIDYNKLFLLTFTSGSTGLPKGVMHSFGNLLHSAIAFQKRFSFGKGNIFYHNLPMTYMAGILNLVVLPFIAGSRIVVGERFNISKLANFWETPIKYSANTFWFIPTILSLLLKMDRGRQGVEYAKQTRIVGCVGTAPLRPQIKNDFQEKYGIQLYNTYGLSETLFVSAQSPGIKEVEGTVGKPFAGVELSTARDNEIMIQAPWMFLGYSNAETADCFEQGRFKSGDIGAIDQDGYLTITDRKKDLIIKGGINVSPKRLEDIIGQLGMLSECAIIGTPDDIVGEKIICCFTDQGGLFTKEKEKELNRQITVLLGRNYQIDEFFKVDKMPANVNGKIDKPRIKKMYDNSD